MLCTILTCCQTNSTNKMYILCFYFWQNNTCCFVDYKLWKLCSATVCRTNICYRTVVCLSFCKVCVLWPNGWIDQDATWYGGTGIGLDKATLCKMGTQIHPTKRGIAATATVVVYASIVMSQASLNRGPCLLWPNGWFDQDTTC